MKKKIFSISCMLLFIIVTIPSINAQEAIETPIPLFNSMTVAHIKIEGTGSSFVIANDFVLGFGRGAFMRFKLNEDSHIEINKFLDTSNNIILDGSHVITIFGFIGYYQETEEQITLNGFTALVFWR
ncbi:MAG: hypothetical protein V3S79_03525 [Candidatus Thermoplasmatota archaeon]